MARAVSSFGAYLGSIEPRIQGDCQTWRLFIATDDLALILHELDIKIGEMQYTVPIRLRKWLRKQVYHRSDLPSATITYQPPLTSAPPSSSWPTSTTVNPVWFQLGDDVVPMSLKVLKKILKDADPSQLPGDLAACLAGNNQPSSFNRYHTSPHTPAAPPVATQDPKQHQPTTQSLPPSNQLITQDPSPTPQQTTVLPIIHQPKPQQATVLPTQPHAALGLCELPDLSLQICSNIATSHHITSSRSNWEPHLLFPELRANTPPTPTEALIATRTNPKKVPKPTQPPAPTLLRCTTRGKITKKNASRAGLNNLDAQAFVDIPLNYAEGQQILQMIGVAHLTIYDNLLDPAYDSARPSSHPLDHRISSTESLQRLNSQSRPRAQLAPKQRPTAAPAGLTPSMLQHNKSSPPLSHPTHTNEQNDGTSNVRPQPNSQEDVQPMPPPEAQLPDRSDTPMQSNYEEDNPYLDRVDYSDNDYAP